MKLKPGWLRRQFEAARRDKAKRQFIETKCFGVYYRDGTEEGRPVALFRDGDQAYSFARQGYPGAYEVREL